MKSSFSWERAADTFGCLQIFRGIMGFFAALFMASIDGNRAFEGANGTAALLGPPARIGFTFDALLMLLHALYFFAAYSLLEGMEKDNYGQCKSWLWLMTSTTILETLGFTILIMAHGLYPILFLDPVLNFIGLWIVHRYMVHTLITHANNNHSIVPALETMTQTHIETVTALAQAKPAADLPPSYEDCISIAIAAQPEIPSQPEAAVV